VGDRQLFESFQPQSIWQDRQRVRNFGALIRRYGKWAADLQSQGMYKAFVTVIKK